MNSPWPVRTTARTPTRCRCGNPPLTRLGKALMSAVTIAGAAAIAGGGWWAGVDSNTAVWVAGLWAANRLIDL